MMLCDRHYRFRPSRPVQRRVFSVKEVAVTNAVQVAPVSGDSVILGV